MTWKFWTLFRHEPQGVYRQQLADFAALCADLPKPRPVREQVREDLTTRIARFKVRLDNDAA